MTVLVVPGAVVGKARHRLARTGRVYTPAATVAAEQRVQAAWLAAGRPTVEGPAVVTITAAMARPRAHWRRDGSLTPAGRASVWPTKRPDVDNIAKLILDGLNGHAWPDDSQVAHLWVVRRWGRANEPEHVRVTVAPMPTPRECEVAA